MASYALQPKWPRLPFMGLDFLPKFRFLSHNLRSKISKKPIKGSNDSKYCLVFNKTMSQKLAHWVGTQGPMTSTKMREHIPIMMSPTKKQNPNFQFFKRYKLQYFSHL